MGKKVFILKDCERLPQTCDNSDTVRSAPNHRKFSIPARFANSHDDFWYEARSVSISCISSLLCCYHLDLGTPFCCWWTQHWKCEVWLSLQWLQCNPGAVSPIGIRASDFWNMVSHQICALQQPGRPSKAKVMYTMGGAYAYLRVQHSIRHAQHFIEFE